MKYYVLSATHAHNFIMSHALIDVFLTGALRIYENLKVSFFEKALSSTYSWEKSVKMGPWYTVQSQKS